MAVVHPPLQFVLNVTSVSSMFQAVDVHDKFVTAREGAGWPEPLVTPAQAEETDGNTTS